MIRLSDLGFSIADLRLYKNYKLEIANYKSEIENLKDGKSWY